MGYNGDVSDAVNDAQEFDKVCTVVHASGSSKNLCQYALEGRRTNHLYL